MTKIIVIDDIFSIEPDIYNRMKNIASDKYFLRYRLEKNVPENNADYNYITNLKCWFLQQAAMKTDISFDYCSWIDFGFDHGGKLFYDENDFSFELQADNLNKARLFYLPDKLDERPLFEIIRTIHPDSLTSGFFICPRSFVPRLWACIRDSIYNLLHLGLMDDDQAVLLLASRRNPELFELHLSYWFLAITCFGGKHMKLNQSFLYPAGNTKKTGSVLIIKRIYRYLKKLIARIFARD